ncbi:MAG: hypothetical protein ACRDHZ_20310 [Ktedonobacteraceae bacterium]
MAASREERNRILGMVAAGQVSADDAVQLFDALLEEPVAPPPVQNRTLRLWVTDMATRSRQVNLTATLPLNMLRVSLQTLASLVPPLRDGRAELVIRALENGSTGRVMDLQNLEDGKRVEIFLEQ